MGDEPLSRSDLLPEIIRKLTGTQPTCDGPNCANAAFLWHSARHRVRHVDQMETGQILADDYRQVQLGEEIRFGDLIVIWVRSSRKQNLNAAHLAIYLDDNVLWHKASMGAATPWTFEAFESVLAHYWHLRRALGDFTIIGISFFRYLR